MTSAGSLQPRPDTGDPRLLCDCLLLSRCEIHQLADYVKPGAMKAHSAERHAVLYWRRGLLVRKPRFIPAQLADQPARKLQAKHLRTVAEL